jgi:hypothetical protein
MLVSVGKFKGICNFPPLPEFKEGGRALIEDITIFGLVR